ncbi:hypothetical protein AB4254_08880 [Vibrio breoganii]
MRYKIYALFFTLLSFFTLVASLTLDRESVQRDMATDRVESINRLLTQNLGYVRLNVSLWKELVVRDLSAVNELAPLLGEGMLKRLVVRRDSNADPVYSIERFEEGVLKVLGASSLDIDGFKYYVVMDHGTKIPVIVAEFYFLEGGKGSPLRVRAYFEVLDLYAFEPLIDRDSASIDVVDDQFVLGFGAPLEKEKLRAILSKAEIYSGTVTNVPFNGANYYVVNGSEAGRKISLIVAEDIIVGANATGLTAGWFFWIVLLSAGVTYGLAKILSYYEQSVVVKENLSAALYRSDTDTAAMGLVQLSTEAGEALRGGRIFSADAAVKRLSQGFSSNAVGYITVSLRYTQFDDKGGDFGNVEAYSNQLGRVLGERGFVILDRVEISYKTFIVVIDWDNDRPIDDTMLGAIYHAYLERVDLASFNMVATNCQYGLSNEDMIRLSLLTIELKCSDVRPYVVYDEDMALEHELFASYARYMRVALQNRKLHHFVSPVVALKGGHLLWEDFALTSSFLNSSHSALATIRDFRIAMELGISEAYLELATEYIHAEAQRRTITDNSAPLSLNMRNRDILFWHHLVAKYCDGLRSRNLDGQYIIHAFPQDFIENNDELAKSIGMFRDVSLYLALSSFTNWSISEKALREYNVGAVRVNFSEVDVLNSCLLDVIRVGVLRMHGLGVKVIAEGDVEPQILESLGIGYYVGECR